MKLCLRNLFLSGSILFHTCMAAQPKKADSVLLFRQLEQVDQLANASELKPAIKLARQVLESSQQKKIPRAEAYANLKIADIHYRNSEYHELGKYDSAALLIAQQLRDPFLISLSYYQLGVYFMSINKGQLAHTYFEKSLAAKFEKDQSAYTAAVYNDIGFNYGNMGQLDKQIDWYLKAVRMYEKVNDEPGLAQTFNNLSTVANELGRRKEAIQYAKKSIAIREKLDDKSALSISYNNICQMYMALDSIEQATHYQELGYKYAELSNMKNRMAHSHITKALLLNRQRKNAEALEYEKKAIILLKETGDSGMLSRRFIAAAIGSSSIKDSVRAVQYFDEAEKISRRLNNKYNLRDVYYHQAAFYKDRKDFVTAYDKLKKYYAYRDSIITEKTNQDITALQLQFETEKKDNEIFNLNASQRIKQLEIEKQKAIIDGNMAEARQRQNEIDLLSKSAELQTVRLKQQSEELEKQRLLSKNKEQELLLARQQKELQEKQLETQKQFRNLLMVGLVVLLLAGLVVFNRYQYKKKLEQQAVLLDMRNNISRNLHDDIGASLSNIHILNELTRRNVKDPVTADAYLIKAGDDIQRISESLSDIVWNINPQYDDLDKLFVRMKRYAADMLEGKNIVADLVFPAATEKLFMAMDQRRDFYLIFKEAVNNLVKYSKATSARVMVSSQGDRIYLEVKDNGKGFDQNRIDKGNGIQNMKQRAAKWGAMLQVQSQLNQGSIIALDMKIQS